MPNRVTGLALIMFTLVMIKVEIAGLTPVLLFSLIMLGSAAIAAAPHEFGRKI